MHNDVDVFVVGILNRRKFRKDLALMALVAGAEMVEYVEEKDLLSSVFYVRTHKVFIELLSGRKYAYHA